MRTLAKFALTIGAAAVFTGCGASQPPIGTSAASSTFRGGVASQEWASSQDLMYVFMRTDRVHIFSYPQGQRIASLTGLTQEPTGLCSDRNGDVFVIGSTQVLEYAHGGTSPIETLSGGGHYCAWDPSSGDLAVTSGGQVEIFRNATGSPQIFKDSEVAGACTYDNKGNLFIDGYNSTSQPVLLEFANGRFKTIALSKKLNYMTGLQWDGKYLVIDEFHYSGTLHRVRVSGSTGKIKSATFLSGGQFFGDATWLQGGTFIASILVNRKYRHIFYWSYPSGGNPIKKFIPKATGPIRAITISVAPTRSRI